VRARPEPGGRELASLVWGLLPSWSKEPSVGFINARAESAASKPAFRTAFRRRRCLVPADGFFEWKRAGKQKQPFYFQVADGRPFAFAGLWERWHGEEGEVIESCALLTTDANATVRPVHNRMPVILQPGEYNDWLDHEQQDAEAVQLLLRPYPAAMTATPVGMYVNNARQQGPECIAAAT
jgi:putative SOS response-associated peptidase YedK